MHRKFGSRAVTQRLSSATFRRSRPPCIPASTDCWASTSCFNGTWLEALDQDGQPVHGWRRSASYRHRRGEQRRDLGTCRAELPLPDPRHGSASQDRRNDRRRRKRRGECPAARPGVRLALDSERTLEFHGTSRRWRPSASATHRQAREVWPPNSNRPPRGRWMEAVTRRAHVPAASVWATTQRHEASP